MPKLKTLSRFLAPMALLALAACQTPPSSGPTTPTTGAEQQAGREEVTTQAPEAQQYEPLLVFIADVTPKEGWMEIAIDDARVLYLAPTPFLTRNDLSGVRPFLSPNGDGMLELILNEDAAQRLASETRNNPGKRLAIVVDDTLLAIPGYSDPVENGRLAFIVGSKENAITAAKIIAGEEAVSAQ